MCKGKVGCKSCARIGKKKLFNKRFIHYEKINFSVLKPAAAGLAGFAAAKMINNIPLGSGKTVGDSALTGGLAKIAVAAIAPGLIGNKVPLIKEAAVGVAIAGFTDIVREYLPSVAPYIAAPQLPSGNPFGRTRDFSIACADDKVKVM